MAPRFVPLRPLGGGLALDRPSAAVVAIPAWWGRDAERVLGAGTLGDAFACAKACWAS